MSDKFTVEIISPDKTILKSETTEVTIPSYEGQMGILKDHIPLITFLRPGIIEIEGSEKFYVEDGTVEFSDNNLLILSATVQSLKKIKTQEIGSMLREAEQMLSKNQVSDKQRYILNYKIETLKQIN